MILSLDRFQTPFGTFGILGGPGLRLYTCENIWLGNLPSVSCVPAGFYELVPYQSQKYPDTWALQNKSLGVYAKQEIGAQRFACLFHKGNTTVDTQGCILPGVRLGWVNESWAVINSSDGMHRLQSALSPGTSGHMIHIRYKSVE